MDVSRDVLFRLVFVEFFIGGLTRFIFLLFDDVIRVSGLGLGLDVWREFRVGGSLEVGVGVLRLHIKEARITLLQNSQYKII